MSSRLRSTLVAAVVALALTAGIETHARAQNNAPDPDLQKQDVPHGTVTRFTMKNSRVYPGSEHNVTVYVPAQYVASTPACVMIFQDGLGFNAPTVFDNLIAKKQMPVTVAIGINPGVAPPAGANPGNALPRYNRSVEYDTPDGTYARFLLEEVLPEVSKTVNLSQNPNDRGLCGSSSGGIAAFNAAWERPDQFRRVYSVIGSFTDLAGGDTYPSKIRKSEPKPLRIYLQDNDHDQDIYSGSWPLANQEVAAALKFAGYDYQFVVGQGGHDGRPGSLIFPEVMRWLWRDYPAPIKANIQNGQPVTKLLAPGEDWEQVKDAGSAVFLTTDAAGNVHSTNTREAYITAPDGTTTRFPATEEESVLWAALPDGRLLTSDYKKQMLLAMDARGTKTILARGVRPTGVVVNHAGILYFVDNTGALGMVDKSGHKQPAILAPKENVTQGSPKNSTAKFSAAGWRTLALSPDQSLLITAGGGPRKVLVSWRIQADGKLTDGQPFFDLTTPYNLEGPEASAPVYDTQGWLYVATSAGIQICDQAGRVNGILALPERLQAPSGMTWGGTNHDTLYIACGSHLYRRKLHVKGVLPFEEPIKPPAPRL